MYKCKQSKWKQGANTLSLTNVFIIARISKFDSEKKKAKNNFNYYVMFDESLICEMISKINFIPGNWYNLTEVELVFYHNLWGKLCMEATITILKCNYKQITRDEKTTASILTPVVQGFITSLINIIEYNKAINKYQDKQFTAHYFRSIHDLCKSDFDQECVTIMANIINQGSHYSQSSASYCYDINFENIKISMIKWKDVTNSSTWIGNKLKNNSINIFYDVDFKTFGSKDNRKRYFNITDKSKVIYEICPEIKLIITKGNYANYKLEQVEMLWLHTNQEIMNQMNNYTMYKTLTHNKYNKLQDAYDYIAANWTNFNRVSAIFNVEAALISPSQNFNEYDIYIRNWCNRCRSGERSVESNCPYCNDSIKPWLQSDTYIYIRGNKNTRSDKIKLGVSLLMLKKMYKYCKSHNLTSNRLSKVISDIENIINQINYQWNYNEEARVFLPLIEVFYSCFKRNKSLSLDILVTKSITSGTIYFNHKLYNIEWMDKNPNTEEVDNEEKKDQEDEPPAKKRKLNDN